MAHIRRCILRPYRKGMGPVFNLTLHDEKMCMNGRCNLSYSLKEGKKVIFKGSDFGPSPMYSIDGDKTVAALLSFLTLKPGDTDPDYFANYTPEQFAFASEHGEAIQCYSMDRFGED